MSSKRTIFLLLSLLSLISLWGEDVLLTKNGARLIGEVTKVEDNKLYLKTNYAGTISVKLNQIQIAEVETELIWLLKDESSYKGSLRTRPETGGWVLVTNSNDHSIALDTLERAWKEEKQTQSVVGTEKKLRDMINISEPRDASFEAGLNLNGKSGNTERFSTAVTLEFKLESDQDRLDLYGSYEYSENGSQRTADEIIGGVSYTNFFYDRIGWFIREELERDDFENVKLRSTTGAGVTYRFIRRKDLSLESRAGFSYRYENYISQTMIGNTQSTEGRFPGLDFGFDINWKFADWGRFKSAWNYVPSFESFDEYLIEQDTGIYFPLAYSKDWKLRVGLSNQFNSNPDSTRKELDTSYYIRLIYSME